MSKNKIAKLLLALGLGVAVATSGVALAGCGNNSDDNENPGIEQDGDNTGDNNGDNTGDNNGDNTGDNNGDNNGDNTGDNNGDNTGDEIAAKSWTVTVANKEPVVSGGDGLTVAFSEGQSENDSDFKLNANDATITLTVAGLKAGEKVSVTVTGYTGSTDNAAGVKVSSVTNATAVASNPAEVEFPADKTPASGTFEYTVNADGDVTIAIVRSVSKTARVTEIVVNTAAAGGEDGQATQHNFTYSFDEITATLAEDVDKTDLTQANFTGANSWLTVVAEKPEFSPFKSGATVQHRGGGKNNVIEIKNVALSFEVQGTATFKITLGSTGGSNMSGFALMKADGTIVEGTVTGGSNITATELNGVYYIYGTAKNDQLTYSDLEEGTYYIVGYADSELATSTDRSTRIYAMSLVDLY